MEKEEALILWQDQLNGEISQDKEQDLKRYLEANPDVAKELEMLSQTWELFDEIKLPEPSTQMDARFDGMLASYQSSQESHLPSFIQLITNWIISGWQMGLTALILGLLIGWWLFPSQKQSHSIQQLSQEISDMKEMMMLTLIEQPKAQERIRAVNMAMDLPDADGHVIAALITTLNEDDNLNVRLASLESLVRYADKSNVREALIEALKMQDSPIMLVAIADALVAIREKSSVQTMMEIKENLEDGLVKGKLEESIQSLTSI